MTRMRRHIALGVLPLLVLAGCSSASTATKAPSIIIENPWVRTTDGATNTTMTALFATLTNPGSSDITLTKADCSEVAGKTEVHEMVKVDGKMVMQEAKNGAVVPKEGHLHMKPGSYHVMLMMLKKPLPVGTEVHCSLTFSDGVTKDVTAPVKVFTEEEDHYHTPMPSAESSAKG